MPRLLFNREDTRDPLQNWPKSSILDRCKGATFFLEPDDCSWLNTARKALETSSWPGFLSSSLVTSVCPEVLCSSSDVQQRFSHVEGDRKTWRLSLDVSHFSHEEIVVKINEGILEISGKHEEKHNDHGTTSRRFTRKYKMPADVDVQKASASISTEGFLLVEVPAGVIFNGCPTETVIPIQIMKKH